MALPEVKLYPTAPPNPHASDSIHYEIYEGWKRYEITNHLGNVLAVITDRKRGRASSGTNIQWFVADVLATQQYYPFGMLMPGNASATLRRQYSLSGADYRYGFNGKEGDDEVKGDDNQQDYGMRIYDPRVARFLSVDPIAREYPWYTPYQFAGNIPVLFIDLDGLEPTSSPQTKITEEGLPVLVQPAIDNMRIDINRNFNQFIKPTYTGNEKMGQKVTLSGIEWVYIENTLDKRRKESGVWVKAPTLEEVNSLYKTVKSGIKDAENKGYVSAAKNLNYWLMGNGGTVEFPEDVQNLASVKSAVNKNLDRFLVTKNSKGESLFDLAKQMPEGSTKTFSDSWDASVTFQVMGNSREYDMYYAWGTSLLTSQGDFTLIKKNGVVSINGSISHTLFDTYDWNPGGSTPLGGENVQDNDLLLLEVYKGAKPFTGQKTWTLSYSKTINTNN